MSWLIGCRRLLAWWLAIACLIGDKTPTTSITSFSRRATLQSVQSVQSSPASSSSGRLHDAMFRQLLPRLAQQARAPSSRLAAATRSLQPSLLKRGLATTIEGIPKASRHPRDRRYRTRLTPAPPPKIGTNRARQHHNASQWHPCRLRGPSRCLFRRGRLHRRRVAL